MTMATQQTDDLHEGQEVLYYPRRGRPGHRVTIRSVRPHIFHGSLVRFRYADGRERELTIGRFHRTPD